MLSAIPSNDDIRRKSASYEIIGRPDSPWGPMFAELAANVAHVAAGAPEADDAGRAARTCSRPHRSGATSCSSRRRTFDMCGKNEIVKPTLEVVYDEV